MPPVNWNTFEQLPGGVEANFEGLCRVLIRRHYGQYGHFAALAAQPGVEFHLKLHTACGLGEAGRWYGWQCRWYDLPSGRAIGTTRRQKIEKAIATTHKELPDLTDWVLWTRHPLTEGDQKWFYGLTTHMRLHLWTAHEVEEHLSGNALLMRGTYFGELVLTPDVLNTIHTAAVAPIRRRWQPDVHQTTEAERDLRRMLFETDTWPETRVLTEQLNAAVIAITADMDGLSTELTDLTTALLQFLNDVISSLSRISKAIECGDLELLQQNLALRPTLPEAKLLVLPRKLRAARHRAAIAVSNAVADIHSARDLLNTISNYTDNRLVAVCADAGYGKTQLAAQLTATTSDRPAGVLLHGRLLHAGHSLDDLARGVVIQGVPASSMEALVAAVDAAGRRSQRRLPIVIDGLNEAEDPRDWSGLLASLRELMHTYPYSLVVCTLRGAFADEALPHNTTHLEIPGFEHDSVPAARKYFDYYKIDPADAELPWDMLSHPLTLRLFCEVTNPTRDRVVGFEAMPESLTALFDQYLKQAADRIAELAPRTRRYYAQDVSNALDEIGAMLWDGKSRSLEVRALRRQLGDAGRPWNESLVHALEQDGVLLRVPDYQSTESHVAPVYDALAGHLVADSILAKYGRVGFEQWICSTTTVNALSVEHNDRHPFATDIFDALVGLVPRRLHRQQLWALLDEPLRTAALRGAANLESAYIDAETVRALVPLVTTPPPRQHDLLNRLRRTRGAPAHPLNANFLDSVLRPMEVADRDLRWTEWVRRYEGEISGDLRRLEQRWRTTKHRRPADRLRARWVIWTLTSTVRPVRDQATHTLYWFGRGEPTALFELTLDALNINDPYVPERLLAASYGVVMAHQLPDPTFADALAEYLRGLQAAFIGHTASAPTNHWLMRHYVQMTVMFARKYYGEIVPDGFKAEWRVPFTSGPAVEPISDDDARGQEVDRTLHMDFENYTVGRLFRNRRNYDMQHRGHQDAIDHIRGTIWALGWRATIFDSVDRHIGSYRTRGDQTITERYGKKYSWIGFYTYAGILADKDQLPGNERLSDIQIDPSFPKTPPPAPIDLPSWTSGPPGNTRDWITQGVIIVPDNFLFCSGFEAYPGSWIAVHGNLQANDKVLGRSVFGLLTAILVSNTDVDRLIRALQTRTHPGGWWYPKVPSDYYTFASEFWWSVTPDTRTEFDDLVQSYQGEMHIDGDEPIPVEILAHRYAWESYHSELNTAGGSLVPSYSFSTAFDLRSIPDSFNHVEPNGMLATLSLSGPAGFDGDLLYLREDLVHRYANGRRLIWFVWGERQLDPFPHDTMDWLSRAQQDGLDVWRYIRRGEELSQAFS